MVLLVFLYILLLIIIDISHYILGCFGVGRVIFWILDLDSDHTASDSRWQLWEVISLGTFNPSPNFHKWTHPLCQPKQGNEALLRTKIAQAVSWRQPGKLKKWFQKGWHRTGMIREGVIEFMASEPTPPIMYPHIRCNKILLRETSHDKLHIFGEHQRYQSELTHRTHYILILTWTYDLLNFNIILKLYIDPLTTLWWLTWLNMSLFSIGNTSTETISFFVLANHELLLDVSMIYIDMCMSSHWSTLLGTITYPLPIWHFCELMFLFSHRERWDMLIKLLWPF